MRALQSANADLVVIGSYPLSSVGILLAANDRNLTPRYARRRDGRASSSIVFKDRLKSKLTGVVNDETWAPTPKSMAPAAEFFKLYQERAKAAGTDLLGYYLGGWGYLYFQLLGQAIEGAKTLNDEKLAEYLHRHEFKTIMGDIEFGPYGEWTKQASMQVQYRRHHLCGELGDLARHELSDGAHARGSKDG